MDMDDADDKETVIDATQPVVDEADDSADRGDVVEAGDEPEKEAPKAEAKEEPKPEPKPEEKPETQAEARIPKSRFDEVNQRMKDAETRAAELADQIAQLQKAPPAKEEPAPNVDIDAKEEAYVEALMAGETKQAAAIRREINAELKRQASQDAKTHLSAELTQRDMTARMESVVTDSFSKYPFLDDRSAQKNDEAIGEVVEWRDFYAAKGHALPTALQMAVAKVGPMFAEQKAEPEVEEKSDEKDEKNNVRNIEAKRRNAAAANAQPAQLAGIGERASNAGRTDVAKMAEEEFDALPAAEKKRLRGD